MASLFSMLGRSFWSPSSYYLALTSWRWRFLAYFALLSLISGAISAVSLCMDIAETFRENTPHILGQVSKLVIDGGEIETEGGKPVFVSAADGRRLFALSQEPLDASETDGLFFSVQKDMLILHAAPRELGRSKYRLEELGFEKGKRHEEEFSSIISATLHLGFIITSFIAMFFAFILNAFYVLVISLAVLMLSLTLSPAMGYARCLKFSVILITPMTLIMALTSFAGSTAMSGFIYAFVTLGLAWYIMRRMPSFAPAPGAQ